MPEMTDELPVWVQVAGGVWCLLTVVLFVRQILWAYTALLGGS